MLHPQCRKSNISEDFFLANSAILISFCKSVVDSWKNPGSAMSALAADLGESLLRFVDPASATSAPTDSTHLLLRSPTSKGIGAAATLFLGARVVVLVRDGPATVESCHRSFGWRYEEAMLRWRKSVREIAVHASRRDSPQCHIVRFEDLVSAPAPELERIIRFVALDATLYPFDRVGEVPVFGSSSFGRKQGETVHWRPVPKDPSFAPLRRAESWPHHRIKRFSWLAGDELRRFGYVVSPLSPLDRTWNVALDAWHLLRRAIVRAAELGRLALRLFSDRR